MIEQTCEKLTCQTPGWAIGQSALGPDRPHTRNQTAARPPVRLYWARGYASSKLDMKFCQDCDLPPAAAGTGPLFQVEPRTANSSSRTMRRRGP